MDTFPYSTLLRSLDGQADDLTRLLINWADVNTGSHNTNGLTTFLKLLRKAFMRLPGKVETISLPAQTILRPEGKVQFPLGKALSIRKLIKAPVRILLTIHYDTVYAADHSFQKCEEIDRNTLKGPGVADAKGGLLVLLEALKLFEDSPWSGRICWEALIIPDEEVGSVGSAPIILEAAKRNDLALVFEPALPDGSLVGSRKGSEVYSAIIKGRAAHAGRNPEHGRNAIHAMANFIVQMGDAFAPHPGIVLNVGETLGGGAVNVVPDMAYFRFNIRTSCPDDQVLVNMVIGNLINNLNQIDGLNIEINRDSSRPPKVIDRKTQDLLNHFASCGEHIGIRLKWGHSGGASDANIIASAGVPAVDGLGVRGGGLHSPDEYVLKDSILERIRLTALFLMKMAREDIEPPVSHQ